MMNLQKKTIIHICLYGFLLLSLVLTNLYYQQKISYISTDHHYIPEVSMWTRIECKDNPEEYVLIYTRDTWLAINSLMKSNEISEVDSISEEWIFHIMLSDFSDGYSPNTYDIFIGDSEFEINGKYYCITNPEVAESVIEVTASQYQRYARGFLFSTEK